MDVTTYTTRSFLRRAWKVAQANARPLVEQLELEADTCLNLFSGGTLQNVSKNTASQSYFSAGPGVYTTPQLEEMWSYLIGFFELCASDLGVTDNDTAVYNEMKARLCAPPTEVAPDISAARCCA